VISQFCRSPEIYPRPVNLTCPESKLVGRFRRTTIIARSAKSARLPLADRRYLNGAHHEEPTGSLKLPIDPAARTPCLSKYLTNISSPVATFGVALPPANSAETRSERFAESRRARPVAQSKGSVTPLSYEGESRPVVFPWKDL